MPALCKIVGTISYEICTTNLAKVESGIKNMMRNKIAIGNPTHFVNTIQLQNEILGE